MTTINDFGLFLKHERELRGIPLEEIANTTKVHMRFLTALENNNFDEFPGEVFIKGYIRSYAKSIGANVETILSAYDECVGKQRLENLQQVQTDKGLRLSRKTGFRRYLLLGISLAGTILAGVYIMDTYKTPVKKTGQDSAVFTKKDFSEQGFSSAETPENTKPDQAAEESESGLNPPPADVSGEEDKPPPPQASAIRTESKKEAVSGPTGDDKASLKNPSAEKSEAASGGSEKSVGEPMRLRIRSKESSWFNVMADNSKQADFILSAGETKSFSGKESFTITIGNRKGAELTLNGRVLELPNSEDNVVRDFQITPKLLE